MKNMFFNNKKIIICSIVSFVIGGLIMCLLNMNNVILIKNSNSAVVDINGIKITANELFEELKSAGGLDAMLNLTDLKILKEKYKITKEDEKTIKDQEEEIFNTYKNYYGYSKEDFLQSNGFKNEEEFLNYLRNDFLYQSYYKDYIKGKLTEKEIKNYYDKYTFGQSDIYVFNGNEADLKGVIKMLKNGSKVSKIQAKYKNVTIDEFEGFTISESKKYSNEFKSKVASLKEGTYSKVFKDENLGETVIYVYKKEKKDTYENLKETIMNLLIEEKQSSDSGLYYQSLIQLRKDNNMKINDSKLKEEYKEYLKQYE